MPLDSMISYELELACTRDRSAPATLSGSHLTQRNGTILTNRCSRCTPRGHFSNRRSALPVLGCKWSRPARVDQSRVDPSPCKDVDPDWVHLNTGSHFIQFRSWEHKVLALPIRAIDDADSFRITF